jgi:hypothetical protein
MDPPHNTNQFRKALTGSVRVARHAGRKHAASAATVITTSAAAKASGSRGLTLYSKVPSSRVTPRPQHLDRGQSVGLPIGLLDLSNAAEAPQRRRPRLRGSHALAEVLIDFQLQMKTQLFIQVTFQASVVKAGRKAAITAHGVAS